MLTKNKRELTGKISVFVDGTHLFSVYDDIDKWRNKVAITIVRKHPIQIEARNFPPFPEPELKQIDSKIVAKIDILGKNCEKILCLLCYEMIEGTRIQIIRDIIKIKREPSG